MNPHILIFTFFFLSSYFLSSESILGEWRNIEDKTGKAISTVELYEKGGRVSGKIVFLAEPNDNNGKPKICTKCEGKDKDKPLVGLVVLKGLAKDGNEYSAGTFLDIETGKIYKCNMWLENKKLYIRTKTGPFFKTLTWIR